jgi:hypothetical protein
MAMQLTSTRNAAWRPIREGVTVTPLKMEGGKGSFLMRYEPGSRSPTQRVSMRLRSMPSWTRKLRTRSRDSQVTSHPPGEAVRSCGDRGVPDPTRSHLSTVVSEYAAPRLPTLG